MVSASVSGCDALRTKERSKKERRMAWVESKAHTI